jgi:two-component system, cell cycle response regulator DivK
MLKYVYVIEDDPKNMKLFKAILKKVKNIEIKTAMEGKKGLEMIENGNPDLIILDIKLPEISGTKICQRLRKQKKFKDVPIIAVSAYAMKGDQERILKAGFNEYLTKPIKVKNFRKTINRYLEN